MLHLTESQINRLKDGKIVVAKRGNYFYRFTPDTVISSIIIVCRRRTSLHSTYKTLIVTTIKRLETLKRKAKGTK